MPGQRAVSQVVDEPAVGVGLVAAEHDEGRAGRGEKGRITIMGGNLERQV
jgi:hypothetical protein